MNASISAFVFSFLALIGLSRAAEMDYMDFKDRPVTIAITGIDGHKLGAVFDGNSYVINPASHDNTWIYNYSNHSLIHRSSNLALTKEYQKRGKESLALRPFKSQNNQKWVFQRDPDYRHHGRQHFIRFGKVGDVSVEINDSYIDYGEAKIPVNARDFSKYQGKLVKFGEDVVFANRAQYNEAQLFKVEVQ